MWCEKIWVQNFRKGFRGRHFSGLIPANRKIFTDIMRAADNLDENDSKLTEFTAFQKRAQGAEQQNKNKQANSANTEI